MPQDQFPNIVAATVTPASAGAITFTEILTGVSLGQGIGMLIDRMEWQPSQNTLQDLDNDGDDITVAIVTVNTLTALNVITDRRIICYDSITRIDAGTAANALVLRTPFVRDFQPPLILAAPRLYVAMDATGAAVAGSVSFRVYFRYIKLTPQEYIELAEAFVLLG